jgi:hypothetical protein
VELTVSRVSGASTLALMHAAVVWKASGRSVIHLAWQAGPQDGVGILPCNCAAPH